MTILSMIPQTSAILRLILIPIWMLPVYVKLPDSFYIATPVGRYNPDWAIAFYEGTVKHIYFIAETKGSLSSMQLSSLKNPKFTVQENILKQSATEMWFMMLWTAIKPCLKKL